MKPAPFLDHKDNVAVLSEPTNVVFTNRYGTRVYMECRVGTINLDSSCMIYELTALVPLNDWLRRSTYGHIRIFYLHRTPCVGFHDICRKTVLQLATSDFLAYIAGMLDALASQEGMNTEPKVFIAVEQPETQGHKVQIRAGFGSDQVVNLSSLCGPLRFQDVKGMEKHLLRQWAKVCRQRTQVQT